MKRWLACALVLAAGCTRREEHVFSPFHFEVDKKCLETPAIIDVLDGPDPGQCPRVACWVAPNGEVYVTDEACDAPPDYVDHTKDDAMSTCHAALVAYEQPNHSPCGAAAPDGG